MTRVWFVVRRGVGSRFLKGSGTCREEHWCLEKEGEVKEVSGFVKECNGSECRSPLEVVKQKERIQNRGGNESRTSG